MTAPPFILHYGDCLAVLRDMPAETIDAIVTDPPYGLSFMGKKWDYDVPSVEVWAECLRVLKPGGHLLAFAGTRTQHRMAVRIEDAGFEIRDLIAWVYGSGFPKSHDVSKAIDKSAGHQRATEYEPNHKNGTFGKGMGGGKHGAQSEPPVTDAARQWEGWGTALKPSLEPITAARKPMRQSVAQNVLQHGTGAINVDGCRIHADDAQGGEYTVKRFKPGATLQAEGGTWKGDGADYVGTMKPGRWPANLIHDGSDEVVGLFPQAGGGSGGTVRRGVGVLKHGGDNARPQHADEGGDTVRPGYSDSGSAARFFYCAKASKSDRDEGLRHLEARRKAGAEFRPNHTEKAEAGETGNPYGRWDEARNFHPTVKPTDLMRYLCRLVTPPGGVVLDPFMGSGSTGKAAQREGIRFIGIERDPDYMEIARARIETALNPEPVEPEPEAYNDNDNTPADLFKWGDVAT